MVRGKEGSEQLLAGSKRERRHFFGLCPVCLNIGEHSACSGLNLPIVRFESSSNLKGSFTIFLFSVRTHILDSNEVWYS